ncbi:GspH/FimT family pseudopilin [Thalassotalea maritima]|uniref:GspH/FimT family pseudopilin n=1 Tax=Thalassotalea maritima TaxID=3242416 RepID=UPI003528B65F
MKKIIGITLIEVLVALLVLSILASVAGPSFAESFKKRQLQSAAEQMYSFMQQARAESLARSEKIHVSVANMASSNWSYGMKSANLPATATAGDCDPTVTDTSHTSACVLLIDDGDGTTTVDDYVLHRIDASEHDGINLQLGLATNSSSTSMVFDPARGTVDNSRSFHFVSDAKQLVVRVNKLGLVKICSNDYAEYPSCS